MVRIDPILRAYLGSQATSGRLPYLPSVSAYYPVTTHQRPCVPTRHTTGIERPWCVDRLPSHISKMVVSTVCVGGPDLTAGSTIFELLVALCTPPDLQLNHYDRTVQVWKILPMPSEPVSYKTGSWCQRNKQRYREAATPLARIRAALNSLWLAHPLSFKQTNFGMTHVVRFANCRLCWLLANAGVYLIK